MKIKLLVLSIIVLVGALAGTSLGCSCAERDQKALYDKADWVFLAEVSGTKLIKNEAAHQPGAMLKGAETYTVGPEGTDVVEASFRVIEYFKKGSAPINVVRDLPFGIGNCSIPLLSGMEYLFFVQSSKGPLKNYVGMCTGSAAVNVEGNDFPKLLQQLRDFAAEGSNK